jgi:hypothetical protein
MAETRENTYEFDVALSFAGEEREYAQEIAARLKAVGLRVFYDTDYQVDMWGEDLAEYLDRIYRLKARYTIMFVSRHYATKMWTRHERRSAFARALEERDAYVLPVRLDNSPLDGLRPTVGYIDARTVGQGEIVNMVLAKLTGAAPAHPSAITRVPRTEAERQQVLAERPPGWEYLYFAAQLLRERCAVEDKYRDHEIESASLTGEFFEHFTIIGYISQRFSDVMRLANKMGALVNNKAALERAFGKPGQAGDPERLAHLAKRWNSAYEEFMDWAAKVRGVGAPPKFHYLLELAAHFADEPIEQYRVFIDEYIAKVDALPAALAAGENVDLGTRLIVSLPPETMEAYNAELARLKIQFQQSMQNKRTSNAP